MHTELQHTPYPSILAWRIPWTKESNNKTDQKVHIICFNVYYNAAAAKSLQSCPTLCDPIDGSPLGSSVPGILQARTLEWVAISFSNAWKWKVKVKSFSHVRPSATPWIAAYQAPPSMGFSRQEYWSGVPLPSLVYYNDPFQKVYVNLCFYLFHGCLVHLQWQFDFHPASSKEC